MKYLAFVFLFVAACNSVTVVPIDDEDDAGDAASDASDASNDG